MGDEDRGRSRLLPRRGNFAALDFCKPFADIGSLFLIKMIDAGVLAFDVDRNPYEFVLGLLRPSLGSLQQYGHLLFCHVPNIP
jgi:hypothetical protein